MEGEFGDNGKMKTWLNHGIQIEKIHSKSGIFEKAWGYDMKHKTEY